jgi:hypothetical protein
MQKFKKFELNSKEQVKCFGGFDTSNGRESSNVIDYRSTGQPLWDRLVASATYHWNQLWD